MSGLNVGDIALISLPHSSNQKTRPVLVVSNYSKDILVAFITTEVEKYKNEEFNEIIENSDLKYGVMARPIIARLKRLNTIDSSLCKKVASLKNEKIDSILRKLSKLFPEVHYHIFHSQKEFIPNISRINYAGRVYDKEEIFNLIDSSMDFWLTSGRFSEKFEKDFADFLGIKHCLLTNSGSSANLLAISALTSPKLGKRQLKPGDEVITTACSFPTTINPIIQNNLVPVFLDINIGTYNIRVDDIEKALSEKTKAIFLAHTLGNPFDLDKVMDFAEKNNLWLIEDNCDALGSRYKGRYTGTFGHISTFSFYPPHHITMGEGGALITNDTQLKRLIESFRDWGRDCWCPSGIDNSCKKRFQWQLGELPYGYDHKYIYSHFGFNLKATDMQASIGVAQLKKLPSFIEARIRNWRILRNGLNDLSDFFILPEATSNSEPSWFGFVLTVKEEAGFTRDDIVRYLEDKNIQTRMLFAGNMIRHPCFDEMRKKREGYRIIGELENTDKVLRDTFWIGVYPGITDSMLDFILKNIREFCKNKGIRGRRY